MIKIKATRGFIPVPWPHPERATCTSDNALESLLLSSSLLPRAHLFIDGKLDLRFTIKCLPRRCYKYIHRHLIKEMRAQPLAIVELLKDRATRQRVESETSAREAGSAAVSIGWFVL